MSGRAFQRPQKNRAGLPISAARELTGNGKFDEAGKFWNQAIDAAGEIAEDYRRFRALREVAENLAQFGKLGEAKRLWGKMSNEKNPDYAAAASCLARSWGIEETENTVGKVLELARRIQDPLLRHEVLFSIALRWVEAGTVEKAIRAARIIEESRPRYQLFAAIGRNLVNAGKPADAKTLWDETVEAARAIMDESERSRALSETAQTMARLGSYRLARLTCDSCRSYEKQVAYREILEQYTRRNSRIRENPDREKESR